MIKGNIGVNSSVTFLQPLDMRKECVVFFLIII